MQDPYSEHTADVNALGWGFASGASRAVRLNTIAVEAWAESGINQEGVQEGKKGGTVVEAAVGAVMVPFIDLASHNGRTPSARVVDTGATYELRTTRALAPGTEVTTNYGTLSNDELFADYGFTVDGNAHDVTQVRVLYNLPDQHGLTLTVTDYNPLDQQQTKTKQNRCMWMGLCLTWLDG